MLTLQLSRFTAGLFKVESVVLPLVQYGARGIHASDVLHDKFFDPKNDIAFKKLFATEEHKPILMSFLNSMLQLSGDRTIKSVELASPAQVPKNKEAKYSILDVKCVDQAGHQYIVEMQNKRLDEYIQRVQYYAAKSYSDQLKSAEEYITLRPVIVLSILNHKLFPKDSSYLSYHTIKNSETGSNDLKDLSWAFLELPKFQLKETELVAPKDRWTFLFKNWNKLNKIPDGLEKEIQEAYQTLEEHNWTSAEKEAYEKALMAEKDMRSAFRYEFNQGVAKGVVQGEHKKAIAIAKLMLSKNKQSDEISELTGLSKEEINAIQSWASSGSIDLSGKREYHSFAHNDYNEVEIGTTNNLYDID